MGNNPNQVYLLDEGKMQTQLFKRDENRKQEYSIENVVGRGCFGIVFKASITDNGEIVAIKKVIEEKKYKNRELSILSQLNHPNIIYLYHAFITKDEIKDDLYLNAVTDYMSDTVYKMTCKFNRKRELFPLHQIKIYSYQIMRGMAYLHAKNIAHRDIKPENILVNPKTHQCKICDFGSAKELVGGESNISQICSRQQRAPELIFGSTDQNCMIDIWSVGLVIAEMLLGHPLFAGDNEMKQMLQIIRVLGTPTEEQIKTMSPNCGSYKLPQVDPCGWNKVFKRELDQNTYEFISSVLVYEPEKRIKPLKALLHPFFDDLQKSDFINSFEGLTKLPNLFEFTKEEELYDPETIKEIKLKIKS